MKVKDLTWLVGILIFIALFSSNLLIPTSTRDVMLAKLVIMGILSIFVIMKAAGHAITAIAHYARETGISEYVIGFLVVSLGTSLPELSTAFIASLTDNGALLLGDVFGANLLDVSLIFGLTAIIGKKIKVKGKMLSKTVVTILVISLLPFLLGLDGNLSRLDGVILLGAFGVYVTRLLLGEKKFGKVKKQVYWKDIWQDMLVFVGCLVALLLSTRWLVISSIQISSIFDIPLFVMGLVFLAVGTSVPELTISIKAILKKESGLAFGDTLGAVVTNSSLVLGITAVINPIFFNISQFVTAGLFMLTGIFMGSMFILKKEITWQEGIALVLLYVGFLVVQLVGV
jgi:cation:H+ antiporter